MDFSLPESVRPLLERIRAFVDDEIMPRERDLMSRPFEDSTEALDEQGMVHDFRDAGVHKFILRPIASGTQEMIDQTRKLVEQLIPEIDALNR